MTVRPVNNITTIDKQFPDDLFVCCVSFEKRCINAVIHFDGEYMARKSLVVRYTALNEYKLRERYQKIIYDTLIEHVENKDVTLQPFDKYNPFSFWKFLEEWSQSLGPVERITVDITTFTKCYLLTILKFLREKYYNATIRLLYTAGIYPEDKPLTSGIKDIVLLPFFGRCNLSLDKSVLVIFLGYEGERAYGIWKSIDPVSTIAIIGIPSVYLGAERVSIKFNEAILAHPQTTKEFIPVLEPLKSMEVLQRLYNEKKYEDHMFYISPLGTKMEVVGTYLFFEKFNPTRAQIVYAYPSIYNEKKYTLDFDKRVWEFYMPPKEKREGI